MASGVRELGLWTSCMRGARGCVGPHRRATDRREWSPDRRSTFGCSGDRDRREDAGQRQTAQVGDPVVRGGTD